MEDQAEISCSDFLLNKGFISEDNYWEIKNLSSSLNQAEHLVAFSKGFISRKTYYNSLVSRGFRLSPMNSFHKVNHLPWVASNLNYFLNHGILPVKEENETIKVLISNPFIEVLGDYIDLKVDKGWSLDFVLLNDLDIQELATEFYCNEQNIPLVSGPQKPIRKPNKWLWPSLVVGATFLTLLAANLWPLNTILWISKVFSISFILLGLVLFLPSIKYADRRKREYNLNQPEAELPEIVIYSCVNNDGAMLSQLNKSLSSIEYPKAKTDLVLLAKASNFKLKKSLLSRSEPILGRVVLVPKQFSNKEFQMFNYGISLSNSRFCFFAHEHMMFDSDLFLLAAKRFKNTKKDVACYTPQIDGSSKLPSFHNKVKSLRDTYESEQLSSFYGSNFKNLPNQVYGTFFRQDLIKEQGGFDTGSLQPETNLKCGLISKNFRLERINAKLFTTHEPKTKQLIGSAIKRLNDAEEGIRLIIQAGRLSNLKRHLGVLVCLVLPVLFQLLIPIIALHLVVILTLGGGFVYSATGLLALLSVVVPITVFIYAHFVAGIQSASRGLLQYSLVLPIVYLLESGVLIFITIKKLLRIS